MTRKTTFCEGWAWFKLNNQGLALGTDLKFYTSVAKGLKLKVKFWGLIPTYAEVTDKPQKVKFWGLIPTFAEVTDKPQKLFKKISFGQNERY